MQALWAAPIPMKIQFNNQNAYSNENSNDKKNNEEHNIDYY